MKKLLVSFLVMTVAVELACPLPAAFAQTVYKRASLDTVTSMDPDLNVPGGTRKVSLEVDNESVRGVLRSLSVQGGFNLVMDESVTGNVTVDLNNVTINQALQSVAALAGIMIVKQPGGIYLAISRQAAQDKGINTQMSKVIKIYYSNASRVANVLNRSIFAEANQALMGGTVGGGGGAGGQPGQGIEKAKADPRTNSVIIIGTAREIELAEAAVAKLDVPRQSKTFYLSHANALDVATMLASSVFNDGTAALSLSGGSGGGGAAAGGGAGQAQASPLRVERQDVQEGSGIYEFGGSQGGGGGQGSVSSGLSSAVTLRGTVKASDTVRVSPEGAMVIPDTRQNSVTILGTAEQIAVAEALIPTLDAQLPQVAIEASLIEISQEGIKELSTQFGVADGRLQLGFNNRALGGQNPGLIGTPTVDVADPEAFARSSIGFSTNPLVRRPDFVMQMRNLVTQNKAKLLANPTVVATHDTESIISIVDEIVRRVTTQIDPSGAITQNVEIGEAGIVMDILPKIGEDGTISMRVRPSVTTVLEETRDAFGNLITLLSKRDMLTQNVRVRDGETLVIGGLIQQRETTRIDKTPVLGELPIVGAMFRASQKNNRRTELVLLITPHILNHTKVTPVHTTNHSGGIGPVETSLLEGGR